MARARAAQVVQAHWDEFREQAEAGGGLPTFVTKEVDEYLGCGILEHGFLRLACLDFQDDDVDDFAHRQPTLASLYAAAARGVDLSGDRAGQPTLLLIQKESVEKNEPHAVARVINIHAAVAFDARDKPRMERMCRYLARPPIAQDRLTLRGDGAVQYTVKKTWRDGTHAIVLQPPDLIARLCAMIPPPNSVGHRGPALDGHVTHAELSISAKDVALTL